VALVVFLNSQQLLHQVAEVAPLVKELVIEMEVLVDLAVVVVINTLVLVVLEQPIKVLLAAAEHLGYQELEVVVVVLEQ
jgi:hypothetical protein